MNEALKNLIAGLRSTKFDNYGVTQVQPKNINIVKEELAKKFCSITLPKEFDLKALVTKVNNQIKYAIPNLIIKVTDFVRSQLREFQMLDKDGQFKVIPEYPEFAWFEGIVNAVLHRDYRVRGDHIRISMYDDRLEIFSPGKLPNTVTLETMKCRRFSRNPRIARILTEFGWVKELNEGVNRIYDEMQRFFLNEPKYSEPNNSSVLLVLENSITSRHLRVRDRLEAAFSEDVWNSLSLQERAVLQYLYLKGKVNTKIVSEILKLSPLPSRRVLKKLSEKNLIVWHGISVKDPKQYYTINLPGGE